ncbi:hypothetical protein [Polaromonas sp. CG9_12]|nr:hypothetical protein [Polaromonas sp. CG9_12]
MAAEMRFSSFSDLMMIETLQSVAEKLLEKFSGFILVSDIHDVGV